MAPQILKWEDPHFDEEEEEDDVDNEEEEEEEEEEEDVDEEALSLCDLPISLVVKEGIPTPPKKQTHHHQQEPDFEFGSSLLGTSILSSSESTMCAADDVFFRGQMIPLRRLSSVSSGSSGYPTRNPTRRFTRSESMDLRSSSFSSGCGLTSTTSSRSNSTRSHNSSNSSCAFHSTRVRNPFHAYPSPKPQIRVPTGRTRNGGSRCRKSTIWDILRLGLIRTPEIELNDWKLRSNNSRSWSKNSSLSSRNSSISSSESSKNSSNYHKMAGDHRSRRRSFDYGFLSGCKCSIKDVETPSKKITKVGVNSISKHNKTVEEEEEEEKGKQQQQVQRKQGRQSMSRHRTFEWLKELSHAAGPLEDDGCA